jgi:ubiquinone/menaquinone biosynthesis C-methylase UbiE
VTLRFCVRIVTETLPEHIPNVEAAGEKVLDVGCGDGAVTQQLAEAGCEVVGVDSSPQLLEAARAQGWVTQVKDAGVAVICECSVQDLHSIPTLHCTRMQAVMMSRKFLPLVRSHIASLLQAERQPDGRPGSGL